MHDLLNSEALDAAREEGEMGIMVGGKAMLHSTSTFIHKYIHTHKK